MNNLKRHWLDFWFPTFVSLKKLYLIYLASIWQLPAADTWKTTVKFQISNLSPSRKRFYLYIFFLRYLDSLIKNYEYMYKDTLAVTGCRTLSNICDSGCGCACGWDCAKSWSIKRICFNWSSHHLWRGQRSGASITKCDHENLYAASYSFS